MTKLAADSRISAFVTHGGLGSTTEIAYMGKPAVMVPLFADQIRNANMLAKHGGAIVLQKYDLISPRRMASALESIIYNKSFGRIPNLDPYGRHLTTMQYYNIDLFLLVFYRITASKPKAE
ncbi:hypothetical protein TELCIR_18932 [Teladorsagia circumcincta]|uniref:glucuronosyltransferase n=1 Tax=Teladorsagia circumcincta TaxID=45464 RepID=A0A2G9TNL9_TELCI|nr:hypothetical protein TELCIR_18932 [Teladorsagia circumcincta]